MKFFSFNLSNVNSLECVSVNNQECKIRSEIINVNTNQEPMSRTSETRHLKCHKTCKCKCRFDASVCNNKQRWNEDKCRCECKELIGKGMCDKGFIWNPSNCECECDKSCDVGEYLDYKNCKCTQRIIDKLVEECSENTYKNETLDIIPLDSISLYVYKKYVVLGWYI